MLTNIRKYPDLFSRLECAKLLEVLFQKRELWETRKNRVEPWVNGEWHTLGTPLYLDLLAPDQYDSYVKRVRYHNQVLKTGFTGLMESLVGKLASVLDHECDYLARKMVVGLPGFHIFPPNQALQAFFGKHHQDRQWETLLQMPDWSEFTAEPIQSHMSFTLILQMPYMGAGLLIDQTTPFEYETGAMYIHSGQFTHAIAPHKLPILPFDWRITLQGHGILVGTTWWLYW